MDGQCQTEHCGKGAEITLASRAATYPIGPDEEKHRVAILAPVRGRVSSMGRERLPARTLWLALGVWVFGCAGHHRGDDEPQGPVAGPYAYVKYGVQFQGRYFCDETGSAWPEPGACWGTFDADVYYPTDSKDGPYPAILAASGHLGNKDAINWVAEHVASYGYIALAFSQPYPAEWNATQFAAGFRTGIDVLKERSASAGDPISGLLDPRFAVIGHSEGGGGTIEAAGTDARVSAAVTLAAWIGWQEDQVRERAAGIRVPTLLLAGTADPINAAGSQEIYDRITLAPKDYVELAGVGHFDFVTGLGPEQYKTSSKKYFIRSLLGRKPRPSGRGGSPAALFLDIAFDDLERRSAARDGAVARGPEVLAPELPSYLGEVCCSKPPCAHTLQRIDQT